jgi:two-component system response regulator YesN
MEESEIREGEVFREGEDPFLAVRELRGPEQTREWFQTLCARVLAVLRVRQENFAAAKAREAADYIREHFADPDLSLPSLCKELYISTSYFSLVFKKYRERTFVDFLTEVRIEKAKELLRTTALKTYEVAERVGYRDAHYFSLSFRKATGITATEYRNGGHDAAP